MVRTKAPLLSLDASGAVGKTLIASSWKGRTYMKKLTVPNNPQSAAQLGVRSMHRFLTEHWPTMTDSDRETWAEPANLAATTPLNAYQHDNLSRWATGRFPGERYPVTAAISSPGVQSPSAIPQGRGIRTSWIVAPLQNAGGVTLHRSLDGAFDVHYTNAIYTTWIETSGAYVYFDTPLQPGKYYYYLRSFSWDGRKGTRSAKFSATVT